MEELHACSQCGRNVEWGRLISFQNTWVCGDCKELFFQRIEQGIDLKTMTEAGEVARPLIRGAARILDAFISAAAVWLILILILVPLGFGGVLTEESLRMTKRFR